MQDFRYRCRMTPVRRFVVLLFLLTFPVCIRLVLPLLVATAAALLPVYVYVSRGRCSPSFPFLSRFVFLALELVLVGLVPLPRVGFQFKGEFQENKLIIASGVSLNNFHEYMTHLARYFPLRCHRPDHSFFNQTNLCETTSCTVSASIKSNHLCNFLRTASLDSLYHPVRHCPPPLAVYELFTNVNM